MTTATLPPPIAVTTESSRAGHSLWDATGRCSRNHDITNPDNVHVHVRQDGTRQLSCLPCRRFRETNRRRETPPTRPANYPALTCRECGEQFTKPADLDITLRGWLKREFCSGDCKQRAVDARKTVTDGVLSADVEWTLAACEGSVTSWADDVFFEPDGAKPGRPAADRTAAARAYCQDCPITAGCLQYAIDRRIDVGVWGGLDPTERRRLVERLGAQQVAAGAR